MCTTYLDNIQFKIEFPLLNLASESDRERYVSELSKYIQVDIFGSCGKGICHGQEGAGKWGDDRECHKKIEQDYMFYLSFENSFCDHYVTEKLWYWLRRDIVPVVMGQANYSAITPPHSVINVLDYSEPRHLASYLWKLMDNETLYLSYFWWKEFYEVTQLEEWNKNNLTFLPSYCRLCRMLNDPQEPPRIVENLKGWWSTGSHCKLKGSHQWSKYSPIVSESPVSGGLMLLCSLSIFLAILILLKGLLKRSHVIRKLRFHIAIFGLFISFVLLVYGSEANKAVQRPHECGTDPPNRLCWIIIWNMVTGGGLMLSCSLFPIVVILLFRQLRAH